MNGKRDPADEPGSTGTKLVRLGVATTLVAATLVGMVVGAPAALAGPSADSAAAAQVGENLALGKAATQSSEMPGYPAPASRAVDGNTDGNFHKGSVSHTNSQANAYWQVDLGAVKSVGDVVVWNRTDCCSARLSDYYVLVSDRPFPYTNLATSLTDKNASVFHVTAESVKTVAPIASLGRYVRIQLAGTGYLSLAEVQVTNGGRNVAAGALTTQSSTNRQAQPNSTFPDGYVSALAQDGITYGGLPDVDQNLAAGATATQSSTIPGYSAPASLAIDGNTDGNFHHGSVSHTNSEAGAWWQVDLGSDQPINDVVVFNRTDCCAERLSNFRVTVTGDSDPIVSRSTVIRDSSPRAVVPITSYGRYVKIQLVGTGYLALAEVQVTKEPLNSAQAGGVNNVGSLSVTNDEPQAWWQADLRATNRVTSVRVWNRTDAYTDRLANLYVLTSAAPFSSTNLDTTLAQTGVHAYRVASMHGQPFATVAVNQDARYVRVQLEGTNVLNLAEVQIFNDQEMSRPDAAAAQAQLVSNPFTMFMHYGLATYDQTSQWAPANTPLSIFSPTNLDTDQWADAAKSATMSMGVLTAKHHNGFALWDTSANDYDVMSSPYKQDIVKKYADSFRAKGLGVGIYFSMWDITKGDHHQLAVRQLRELLTQYGPIEQLWLDGWDVSANVSQHPLFYSTYNEIAYKPVIDFIRNVSPNTVVVNNDKHYKTTTTDVITYEQAEPPAGLTTPTQWCATLAGADWFETNPAATPAAASTMATRAQKMRTNGYQYLLNVGPSKDGRFKPAYVTRLAEIGDLIRAQ
jgi:alpha-L-fucosidase